MKIKKEKALIVVAFIGLLFVAGQLIGTIFGHPICGSEGCKAIEQSTRIPHVFELLGIGYCLTLLCLMVSRLDKRKELVAAFLLAGIATEAILIGYQAFIAHQFCKFCLMFAGLVLTMNLIMGLRHMVKAGAVLIAPVMALYLISPTALQSGGGLPVSALDNGTWATCACDCNTSGAGGQECRYLIYSPTCGHCDALMVQLQNLNCAVHLNPVKKPSGEEGDLPFKAQYKSDCKPQVNQKFLANLGIDTVPTLVVRKGQDETRIIVGGRKILHYLQQQAKADDKHKELLDMVFSRNS